MLFFAVPGSSCKWVVCMYSYPSASRASACHHARSSARCPFSFCSDSVLWSFSIVLFYTSCVAQGASLWFNVHLRSFLLALTFFQCSLRACSFFDELVEVEVLCTYIRIIISVLESLEIEIIDVDFEGSGWLVGHMRRCDLECGSTGKHFISLHHRHSARRRYVRALEQYLSRRAFFPDLRGIDSEQVCTLFRIIH